MYSYILCRKSYMCPASAASLTPVPVHLFTDHCSVHLLHSYRTTRGKHWAVVEVSINEERSEMTLLLKQEGKCVEFTFDMNTDMLKHMH